jgi:hypothetical protein
MFIVKWDPKPPPDKQEWVEVLRRTLASELGSYRVLFRKGKAGWRFAVEWRPDHQLRDDGLIANTPETVAFNIYQGLVERAKPLEPGWRP